MFDIIILLIDKHKYMFINFYTFKDDFIWSNKKKLNKLKIY
jgi:hypothetical protein